jgi:hypothetical protein
MFCTSPGRAAGLQLPALRPSPAGKRKQAIFIKCRSRGQGVENYDGAPWDRATNGDSATIYTSRRLRVPPTYVLARDHLQRAATILQGTDQRSRQLRHIIERTIGLMEEFRAEPVAPVSNVLELDDYRHRRQ